MLSGILCVNKDIDYTSQDVCNVVKKILNTKKIGHSGTLDPMAKGVMGILVGNSTRLSSYITSGEKEYIAKMDFFKYSDTYDIWGEVEKVDLNIDINREDFEQIVNSFIGNIVQTPPVYSAIKVKGKPLYTYARNKKEVEIPKREVFIKSIEILDFNFPKDAKIKVICSKGTYIRSLIDDIGKKIGCCAVMSDLIRTKNGKLIIENSITLEELKKANIEDVLIKDDTLLDLKSVIINKDGHRYVLNGNKVKREYISKFPKEFETGEEVKLYIGTKWDNAEDENKFLGIGKIYCDYVKPTKLLYKDEI